MTKSRGQKKCLSGLGLALAVAAGLACAGPASVQSETPAPTPSSTAGFVLKPPTTIALPPSGQTEAPGGLPAPAPADATITPTAADGVVPVPPRPTTIPTFGASPVATANESGAGATVTLSSQGTTLRLRAGDRFLLNLGDPYEWTVTIGDPTVLARVSNISVVRGAQGVYEAKTPGQTELQAVGDLPCRKSTPPCMVPSRLFRMTVVVS